MSGNKAELVARLNGSAPPPKKKLSAASAAASVPLAGVHAEVAAALEVRVLTKSLKDGVLTRAGMVDANWCALTVSAVLAALPR